MSSACSGPPDFPGLLLDLIRTRKSSEANHRNWKHPALMNLMWMLGLTLPVVIMVKIARNKSWNSWLCVFYKWLSEMMQTILSIFKQHLMASCPTDINKHLNFHHLHEDRLTHLVMSVWKKSYRCAQGRPRPPWGPEQSLILGPFTMQFIYSKFSLFILFGFKSNMQK